MPNRQRKDRSAAYAQEIALLDEVGVAMKDASICGLGQTAYAAIESAIHRVGVARRHSERIETAQELGT